MASFILGSSSCGHCPTLSTTLGPAPSCGNYGQGGHRSSSPNTIIDIVDTVEERRWRYLLSCFDIIIIIQVAVFCVDIVDVRYIAPQIWCWLESWWRVLASVEYVHCNPSLQPSPHLSSRAAHRATELRNTRTPHQFHNAVSPGCAVQISPPGTNHPAWQQHPDLWMLLTWPHVSRGKKWTVLAY